MNQEQRNHDPVIDEIREVRHQISAECGHDPARLVAYYLELQKQHADQLLPTGNKETSGGPTAA